MGRFLNDSKPKGRNLLASSAPKGRNLLADNKKIAPRKPNLFDVAGVVGATQQPFSRSVESVENALPAAGQTVGGVVGGYPGSVAGAGTGKVASNILKGLRKREFVNPTQDVGREMAGTATIEALFRGAGKLARPAANRLMLSIMKPGREVIKRNPNLGVEAVEQGIYGSKSQMVDKAQRLIKQYENEVASKLKGRPERINAQRILSQLDKLKSDAIKGLKPEDARAIDEMQKEFISQIPSKTVKESRQFVTSVSKSVKPQITTARGASVSNKVAEPVYDSQKGKYLNDVVTPKKFIESPEDIVALHTTGLPRKITSISPKTTYSIDPKISPEYSVSREVFDPLGMNLEAGQAMKKAIYSETPNSAFYRQMSELPGRGEARRTIASGIRKQIIGAAPEVKPILRREAVAINTKEALENRLANEAKNMIIPKLAGMGAGGLALSGHPAAGAGVFIGDRVTDLLRSAPMISGTAKNILRLKEAGRPITLAATQMVRKLFGG